MNIFLACSFLFAGLLILWKSADLLVDGAVGLAKWLGVTPLVIGLTVVAMGTSAPELAASIAAVVRGMGDTAIGNVYGSNIANLALVAGVSALIRPIEIDKQTLQREIPVMFVVAFLLWPFLHNLSLSRIEATTLVAVFVVLILLAAHAARKDAKNVKSEPTSARPHTRRQIRDTKKSVLFIAIGLAGLAFGAEITVRGAVVVGRQIGLSDAVIGLTIIAVGTSLPELATCLVAAIKAQHEISVGNLVGSNIFNTLLVVGAAGVVHPFAVGRRMIGVDFWIMIIVSAGFGLLAVLGRRTITRPGAVVLLCGYAAYIVYLFVFTSSI